MRNEKLIHALGNCINHCNYCADSCLDEDDVKKMVDCIRTDKVCAEVCSALSQVLATSYSDVRGLVQYCKKKFARPVQMNAESTKLSIVKTVQRHARNA